MDENVFTSKITAKNLIDSKIEKELTEGLNLIELPAPQFVPKNWGVGGDLSGFENGIGFKINGKDYISMHTLSRWGRVVLSELKLKEKGIFTSISSFDKDIINNDLAFSRNEKWCYAIPILETQAKYVLLKQYAKKTYRLICKSYKSVSRKVDSLKSVELTEEPSFISLSQIIKQLGELDLEQKLYEIVKSKKAVFVFGIGNYFLDGERLLRPRSVDAENWNLNGEMLVYDSEKDEIVQFFALGIGVDEKALLKQANKSDQRALFYEFCSAVRGKRIPLAISCEIVKSQVYSLILDEKSFTPTEFSAFSGKDG